MRNLDAGFGQLGRDRSQRKALAAQRVHPPDRSLLRLQRDQPAVGIDHEAERHRAAELAAGFLPLLGGPDAFTDPVALELGERRDNGQEQSGDAVAADIVSATVQIEQEQADTARLERFDDGEAVRGGTEHAIELGGNQRIPGAKAGPKFRPFGPLMERDRTRYAGLDVDGVETDAALQCPAFELAPLNVEALAVLGLAVGRNAAVSERARFCGRGAIRLRFRSKSRCRQ